MKWFGESWGAPVCVWARHVATPVGRECSPAIGGCGKPILGGDQGVALPGMVADSVRLLAAHLDCWYRIIGGPCREHGVLNCDGAGTPGGVEWLPRICDGCGKPVAARSPEGRVLCTSCHPGDLPFVPGGGA